MIGYCCISWGVTTFRELWCSKLKLKRKRFTVP